MTVAVSFAHPYNDPNNDVSVRRWHLPGDSAPPVNLVHLACTFASTQSVAARETHIWDIDYSGTVCSCLVQPLFLMCVFSIVAVPGWGPASDTWTLGVTGCFLVSGQLIFNSHDPQDRCRSAATPSRSGGVRGGNT